MKKVLLNIKGFTMLVLLAALFFAQSSCKKNASGNPIITSVRNYMASPNDTLLNKAGSGQWIVIEGSNLKGATAVIFDGINASFNEALFSENTAVVLIPAIPYNNVPVDKINTIRYVTIHGETVFKFSLVPPAPTITSISNENALPGDSITVIGTNFFYIQSISFGGSAVSVFKANDNGTSMGMRVPAGLNLNQGAPLIVTTQSGTATTPFNVNLSTGTGVLFNFDGGASGTLATNQNNAPIENNPTLFPSNRGNYMRMNPGIIPANDFGYRNGRRLLWSNQLNWIPSASMTDPVDSWALKFEIYCQKPFSNGVIYIEPSLGTWYFANRFEPWKTTPNYKPNGWTTITIPFSQFLAPLNGNNGLGAPPATITDLLITNLPAPGSVMRFNLCGGTAPADLDFAIDNLRCVKIK